MTTNKRKKNTRQRGSHTHGWGSKKKHRGAGNRGGRGMAGTGKRADHKKTKIINLYGNAYFGKKGFTSKSRKKIKAINLKVIEQRLANYLSKGLIKKEKDSYILNTKDLGYNKVLANGKLTKKFKITSDSFSKKAITRIQEAGGEAKKEK